MYHFKDVQPPFNISIPGWKKIVIFCKQFTVILAAFVLGCE